MTFTAADVERGVRAFFAAIQGDSAAFRVLAYAHGRPFIVAVCNSVAQTLADLSEGQASLQQAKRAVLHDLGRILSERAR